MEDFFVHATHEITLLVVESSWYTLLPMKIASHRHEESVWFRGLLWGMAVTLFVLLLFLWIPKTTKIVVTTDAGKRLIQDAFPVKVHEYYLRKKKGLTLSFRQSYTGLEMSAFTVRGRGCLRSLLVNDISVPIAQCNLSTPLIISLPSSPEHGSKRITMRIESIAPGSIEVDMTPNGRDPLGILLILGYVLLLFSAFLPQVQRMMPRMSTAIAVATLGIVLRIYYVFQTPYNVRAYDDFGHIPYIDHFTSSLSLPSAASGWEFHQPPLYYFVSSWIVRLSHALSPSMDLRLIFLQQFSLILSLVAFGLMIALGARLSQKAWRTYGTFYVLILATFVGFVMFSSRISNDLPSLIFALIGLLASIRLWQEKSLRFWYIGVIAFSLGFLTKLNAIVGAPALVVCFLFLPGLSRQRKVRHGIIGLFLGLILTAWLPIMRFSEAPADVHRLINIGTIGLDGKLKIHYRSPLQLITFNPGAMIEIPFVNSWNEATRRSNFLEYFFRSAFFGEYSNFHAKFLAPFILGGGMIVFLWTMWGAYDVLRSAWKKNIPLLVTVTFVVAAAVLYPFLWQFSCNQDFRFSMILLVPIAYFTVHGVHRGPKVLCWIGRLMIVCFSIFSAIFILAQ